jgi:hypothetical protein
VVQNFAWQTNSLSLYIVSFFISARDSFNRFLKSSGKWLIFISYAACSAATLPEEGPPRVRLADPFGSLPMRQELSVGPEMKRVLSAGYRRPRESGGPEPAPGLNRGQPLRFWSPWIPAFAGMTNNPLSFLESFQVRSLVKPASKLYGRSILPTKRNAWHTYPLEGGIG